MSSTLPQAVSGQMVHCSTRRSAEVIGSFFDDCQMTTPTTPMSSMFIDLMQEVFQHSQSDAAAELRLLDDPRRLLQMADLDEASAARRRSATVIEQVFDAMDFTQQQHQQQRDAPRTRGHGVSNTSGSTSIVAAQYSCSQGMGRSNRFSGGFRGGPSRLRLPPFGRRTDAITHCHVSYC